MSGALIVYASRATLDAQVASIFGNAGGVRLYAHDDGSYEKNRRRGLQQNPLDSPTVCRNLSSAV